MLWAFIKCSHALHWWQACIHIILMVVVPWQELEKRANLKTNSTCRRIVTPLHRYATRTCFYDRMSVSFGWPHFKSLLHVEHWNVSRKKKKKRRGESSRNLNEFFVSIPSGPVVYECTEILWLIEWTFMYFCCARRKFLEDTCIMNRMSVHRSITARQQSHVLMTCLRDLLLFRLLWCDVFRFLTVTWHCMGERTCQTW